MAKKIAVINFKGGVGKTTLTFLLGKYWESFNNKKVLLIDIDAQSSLTTLFELYPSTKNDMENFINNLKQKKIRIIDAMKEYYDEYKKTGNPSFPTYFKRSPNPLDYIFKITENFYLLPADDYLYLVEMMHFRKEPFKNFFNDFLEGLFTITNPILETFDYIIFDCPPNFVVLTLPLFETQDYILMPVFPNIFSEKGLKLLLLVLKKIINKYSIKQNHCIMILFNKIDNRDKSKKDFNNAKSKICNIIKSVKTSNPNIKICLIKNYIPDRPAKIRDSLSHLSIEPELIPILKDIINEIEDCINNNCNCPDNCK